MDEMNRPQAHSALLEQAFDYASCSKYPPESEVPNQRSGQKGKEQGHEPHLCSYGVP
jgi:hypothetical protein